MHNNTKNTHYGSKQGLDLTLTFKSNIDRSIIIFLPGQQCHRSSD